MVWLGAWLVVFGVFSGDALSPRSSGSFLRFQSQRASSPVTDTEPRANIFKSVWSPDEKKKAVELFLHLDETAKKHGVERPSLFYGTALGQARHNAIIPWDDDMDCMMTETAFNAIKSTLQRDTSTFSLATAGGGTYWKLFYTKDLPAKLHQHPWSWPFLDIFLAKPSDSQQWKIATSAEAVESYDATDIFPLVSCSWEGHNVMCPAQNKKILDKGYSGWDKDCDSGGYDHKKETGRPETQRVPCTKLSSLFDISKWHLAKI